ncbi:hypothetical protein M9H77_06171 [Catharanthus roseus]|uniref:Uncharacterized protein n=1 Tax=Catharanthus roseus TaxID=4058 RepID=A0ACC0BRJ5_CATRO|nr:hypothetical protein M9H77_06171 [Catharanthus roseus]
MVLFPLVGSTLTANGTSRPWLSPSGDLAFGFCKLQDKNLSLLSIWYAKIPDTVVWFNNELDPVSQGSTVHLAQTGLVLRNPQGRLLWRIEDLAGDVDHVVDFVEYGKLLGIIERYVVGSPLSAHLIVESDCLLMSVAFLGIEKTSRNLEP